MLKLRPLLVTEVVWPPLDEAEKLEQQNLITNTYVKALRVLAPDTGAYINEVLPPPTLLPPLDVVGNLSLP
jgi:hypothetical protein